LIGHFELSQFGKAHYWFRCC